MQQPKFEIGQKIQGLSNKVCVVKWIEINAGGIYYNSEDGKIIAECNARAYQEPEQKIAYAFTNRFGDIMFRKTDAPYGDCSRAPEYDFVYPEVR